MEARYNFMRIAIETAREGLKSGNPPFASILVLDDQIIAKAFNTSLTEKDPMAHGEVNLIKAIPKTLSKIDLARATVYATNEPCPMCSGALYWSGIRKLVYGSSREELTKLRSFGLNVPCRDILLRGSDAVEVYGPTLEIEVMPLYEEFYSVGKLK